jgi:ribonucleoside-diphosphate reductase beta chain
MSKNKRFTIFPIQYPDLWDRYVAARNQYWVPEEIDLSQDKWHKLTEKEQDVLKMAIGFFVASDIIVNENIVTTILDKVGEAEAEFYYHFQLAIENIHSEMYSLFVERYIPQSEQEEMFESATRIPTIKKKTDWVMKWMESDNFEESMIAFACVEGLSFSVLFSLVFYFKESGQLPGLCNGNLLILKDEQSHYEFGTHYFKNYTKGLPDERIREIILECCEVEKQFAIDTLGSGLPGLTKEMMLKYVEFVTDGVLKDFGLEKEFNTLNPLSYMAKIAMDSRSNFFESRAVNEYTRAIKSDNLFDEDF